MGEEARIIDTSRLRAGPSLLFPFTTAIARNGRTPISSSRSKSNDAVGKRTHSGSARSAEVRPFESCNRFLRSVPNSLHSLHSALKEFFDPLRTNNSRTDFFTVYRKEADEFDRDYAKKYDEDLNTSLIFVSGPTPIVDAEC